MNHNEIKTDLDAGVALVKKVALIAVWHSKENGVQIEREIVFFDNLVNFVKKYHPEVDTLSYETVVEDYKFLKDIISNDQAKIALLNMGSQISKAQMNEDEAKKAIASFEKLVLQVKEYYPEVDTLLFEGLVENLRK